MTDQKPPADDAARATVESGSPVEPVGPVEPNPGAEPQASVPADGEHAKGASVRDAVTVRRSPRYGRFIVLGVGAGAIVTFVLTNLFEIDPAVGFGPLFGYLLLFGIPAGATLGGLLAVVLDAVTSRRARTLEAERTTVDAPPEVPLD